MASIKDFLNQQYITRQLPNGGGSYSSMQPTNKTYSSMQPTNKTYSSLQPKVVFNPNEQISSPYIPVVPPPVNSAPPVQSNGGSSLFDGVSQNSNLVDVPSKYINPATGQLYTSDEIVANMAKSIPQSKNTGDVMTYANNAINNPNQSVKDLNRSAYGMRNAANDIGVGATDPYDITRGGEIVYSPAERQAIQKAMAGIYDPALSDVFTKLEAKKEEDKLASERAWEKEKMALQHQYSMAEWLAGGGEGSFKSEIASTGRQAIATMLKIGKENPGIFGKTAAVSWPDALRSDAYRNYTAQLDSLKGNIIPAALTAMREASKTGGALGQVSDREGAWLSASLGALSMAQSPEQALAQLKQIDEHLAIWEDAVNKYGNGTTGGVLRSPDGTQEVSISDLTPEELEEAKAAGWK